MYLEADDSLSNTRTNSLPCNAGNEYRHENEKEACHEGNMTSSRPKKTPLTEVGTLFPAIYLLFRLPSLSTPALVLRGLLRDIH